MDDNRILATSVYQSINKHVSGCDIKRDSFFLGDSPSKIKLISDLAPGIRLFPGAAAHQKNNRPVNMRPETRSWLILPSCLMVKMRPETGLKISRGGEKKESSCHNGHIDPSITSPLIADDISREVFLALFPQHRPTFFKQRNKSYFEEVHIG